MRIRQWKISRILYAGFGLLVLVYLLSSIVNAAMMRSMQGGLVQIEQENNVQIGLANDMLKAISGVNLSVRKVMMLVADDEIAAEVKVYQEGMADYRRVRERLAAAVTAHADNPVWKPVEDAYARVAPLLDRLYQAVQAHQDTEAMKVLAEAGPAIDAWQQAIEASQKRLNQANHAAFEDSSRMYGTALWLLAGVTTASTALALLISVGIVRLLVAQLGGEPREAAEVALRIGAGDLTRDIEVRAGDQTSLMAAMQRMQNELVQVVGAVRQGSERVAMASAEIAHGNHDLSARTEQQASALEETAASMEQMNAAVGHNAAHAREASELAANASHVARQGGEVVHQVVGTMREINAASNKITGIIGVIDGIAFQTNILALNAAVEAARAGEQGRGFAVVASEVRSLAGRSAEAAKQIKELLSDSVQRAEQGSQLADRAGAIMSEVVDAIGRVTDIVAGISSASGEQSDGVSQVSEAVAQMDRNTQQNAALVEQMAAAASSLQGQARELVSTVERFRLAGGAASPLRLTV